MKTRNEILQHATVKRLIKDDCDEFYNVRLESLKNHPKSFMTTYEEETKRGIRFYESLLEFNNDENIIFGVFYKNKLIGIAGLYRDPHSKARHKCHLWGMYIQKEFTGFGIAKVLMDDVIKHAKANLNCSIIHLSVNAENNHAKNVYESFGFTIWAIEPLAFQIGGIFYDEYHMSLTFYD